MNWILRSSRETFPFWSVNGIFFMLIFLNEFSVIFVIYVNPAIIEAEKYGHLFDKRTQNVWFSEPVNFSMEIITFSTMFRFPLLNLGTVSRYFTVDSSYLYFPVDRLGSISSLCSITPSSFYSYPSSDSSSYFYLTYFEPPKSGCVWPNNPPPADDPGKFLNSDFY